MHKSAKKPRRQKRFGCLAVEVRGKNDICVPIVKKVVPIVELGKIKHDDPCPCGSGKKYKTCDCE